jgi:hypothetical protein
MHGEASFATSLFETTQKPQQPNTTTEQIYKLLCFNFRASMEKVKYLKHSEIRKL